MLAEQITLAGVPERLCQSEINFSLSSFWDGGWTVKLGDEMNGFREEASIQDYWDALKWLDEKAREHYPESLYATGKYPKGWMDYGDVSATG